MSVSVFDALENPPSYNCGLDYTELEPFVLLREAFKQVPEKCRNCSFLITLGERAVVEVIAYADAYHDSTHELDVDPAERREVIEQGLTFTRTIMEHMEAEGFEIPEEAKHTTAEQVIAFGTELEGMILESDRADALEAVELFKEGHDGCNGPIKMRATKNNKQFTATICTSDTAINSITDPLEYPASIEIKRV